MDELEAAGIPIHGIGKRGRWDLIGPYRRLVKILEGVEPEIVHSFLGPPNIMAAVAKPRIHNTWLVWGFRASNMDMDRYDWSFRVTEWLQRKLVRRPDRIVVNSEAGRSYAASQGFPAALQMVIPNGIDTSKFSPDPAGGRANRDSWGIPPQSHLVGLIARLDPMKDHHTFLQAAAIAAAKEPDLRFVCVGDGPAEYRAALHREASELELDGRITWTGERQDLAAVYSAMNTATLSSAFGEGFPNAVGEAMACQVPCSVTAVGDAPAIVGETGIVTPPGNPEALAAAWQTLASEPPDQQQARAKACRMRVESKFSVATMVKAHAHLYQELVSGHPPGG